MIIILECRNQEYFLNGKKLTPERSLKSRNHSPTGFAHGYGGSGPAQLALAILLETTNKEPTPTNYQQFKCNVIATLPEGDFLTKIDLTPYLK